MKTKKDIAPCTKREHDIEMNYHRCCSLCITIGTYRGMLKNKNFRPSILHPKKKL